MRHIYIIKGIALAALMSLASCVKDDLYDQSGPDPDLTRSKLTVQTDFSDMSLEAVIPPTCRLIINDGAEIHETDEAKFDVYLPHGSYNLLLYSLPLGFSVNGNIATVDAVGGTKATAEIEPQPGYLFASAMEVTVDKAGEQIVTMPMKQLVRRLNFKIYENYGGDYEGIHVESAEATLNGVATSVDMVTGELLSDAASVSGTFETSGIEHSLFFRVLGVVPSEPQTLTVELTWSTGEKKTIETDLTELINDDTDIQIFESEVTPPASAGVGGELSPWQSVDGGGGDAI